MVFALEVERDYAASEIFAITTTARHNVAPLVQGNIAPVTPAIVLAAGMIRSPATCDALVRDLMELGGAYPLLAASRAAAEGRIDSTTPGRLLRAIRGWGRRISTPIGGSDWGETCLIALGPRYGDSLIPHLCQEHAWRELARLGQWWPQEAAAALVRLTAEEEPGVRVEAARAIATLGQWHPEVALQALHAVLIDSPALRLPVALGVGELALSALTSDRAASVAPAVVHDLADALATWVPGEHFWLDSAVAFALARLGREWTSALAPDLVERATRHYRDAVTQAGNNGRPAHQLAARALGLAAGIPAVEVTDDTIDELIAPLVQQVRSRHLLPDTIPLDHLGGHPNLEELDLRDAGIRGSGMTYLARLTRLRSLWLGFNDLADDDMAGLAALTELRELDLAATAITDAGLAHLAPLRRLEKLCVGKTSIGDAGLAHFSVLTSLQLVDLSDTLVSDAGMPYLAQLPMLRVILLAGTAVSEAGRMSLEQARPDLVVLS
jgi:hypothetical protein